jgi:hypothetical protein
MVSLFYSSNERKERKYVKENKIRELNEEAQQQVVDSQIRKELGLEEQATDLGKLASRVFNKIGTELVPKSFNSKLQQLNFTPLQYLTNSIEKGQLTNLFDKLKALPNSSLNKKQRLIKQDLSNEEFKKIMNENIAESVPSGTDAIAKTVMEVISGSESDSDLLDMIQKASSDSKASAKPKQISEAGFSKNLGREKKKPGRKPKQIT